MLRLRVPSREGAANPAEAEPCTFEYLDPGFCCFIAGGVKITERLLSHQSPRTHPSSLHCAASGGYRPAGTLMPVSKGLSRSLCQCEKH